nr:MAG TPA: Chromatin remodeling complex ATPase [Caudoviricetes sp.]
MIELLEHNKPTYADLCEKMEKHNKVALVQATGTGKSYIIGKYLEEHKGKTLILVPTNAIGNQWEKLMAETDCDVMIDTYQGMAAHIEDESGYDIVIADEMHHLGSDVWGTAFINLFMQNTTQKVIGTTATEIRYLDNSRDMVEELFNGVAARGCDLRTAIENGILPSFTYVSVWYGNDKDYEEYAKKAEKIKDNDVRKRTTGKLELCKQNQKSIEQAIKENLSDEPHKIVVFMNSIGSMDKVEKKIKKAFSADKIYKINSLMKKAQIRKNVDGFSISEDGNTVLFAIDMLNEGVHIDGVDVVAFFRTTESPAIYFQQLGRCLAVSRVDKKRTVFDFVCNSSNIRSLINDKNEKEGFIGNLNKRLSKEKKIIIKSYTKELKDLLLEIDKNIGCSRYTDEEIDFIRNNSHLTIEEIAEKLGRPRHALYKLVNRLGMDFKSAGWDKYDEDKVDFILQHKNDTAKSIANELGISINVVYRVLRLNKCNKGKDGYKCKKWTQSEIDVLLNKNFTIAEKAKMLNRSYTSCKSKYDKIQPKGVRPIGIKSVDNNGKTTVYKSAREAARALNKDHKQICKAAKEGSKAYGFRWEYIYN